MKAWYLVFIAIVGVVFSCTTKQENSVIDKAAYKESLPLQQVTLLSNLPDSLQPKTVYLDKMPAPKVVAVGKNGGVTKMLPILRNEKGQPISDSEGNYIPIGDAGKSNFTNFNTDDGLASDVITFSKMDKAGNLWFGTIADGVIKYDGKSFTNFTTDHGLAHSAILSMLEDKSGNIWFGTQGGVSKYDGKSFTNYTTADGLVGNNVNAIIEDKTGNLWFGIHGGVSKYNPSDSLKGGKPTFINFTTAQGLKGKTVSCLIEDKNGNIWIGTHQGGISKYDPSVSLTSGKPTFTNFDTTQGLAHNAVTSIVIDKSGNFWFGTFFGGASKYDGKSFTNFTTVQGLADNTVNDILEDKSGNLWFGTKDGVSKYDPAASLKAGKPFFTNYTTAQGLAGNNVSSIIEDNNGILWFGTRGDGVSKYEGNAFTFFGIAQGLETTNLRTIAEDKAGNLWFGRYEGGVCKYDGKSFTYFNTAQGLAGNNVSGIIEDRNGNLWFGTNGGLSKYDGKTFTNFTSTQGLADNAVYTIIEDKSGNLWFDNRRGITKYDGKSFINFTTAQGLASNSVTGITEDKLGNIWIGIFNGGVSKYDGKSFTNFTTAQGLVSNAVNSITEDKGGNLWFATRAGLSVMPAGIVRKLATNISTGSTEKLFQNFYKADGLSGNSIRDVIQMPNGKIAVGTNAGITLFNVSTDYSKLTDIEIFNGKTGYPVKYLESMYLDSKGIFWASTPSDKTGLVRFDYAALHKQTAPPTLVLQSVKIKDEPICWSNLQTNGVRKTKQDSTTALLQEFLTYGKSMTTAENDSILMRFGNIQFDGITKFNPIPENLKLPYEHNQITFDYVAINNDRTLLVKYQYILEGIDKNWKPETSKNNVSYNNLSEGTYTFKVKAKGSNGVWSEPITYSFKVLPPWYRAWWAYLIYVLGFASLIWLFVQSQKRKAAQKEREKAKDRELTQAREIEKAYTELKSAQAQLIQSEKMASLGELTAGIAHEIQNPLNFVNNFSEVSKELLIEMKDELAIGNWQLANEIASDVEQNLEKIHHHGKRADAIVKGMLQHSRSSIGVKEPTDINALCDEYLRLSYHGLKAKDKSFNATMKTDFDESIGNISIIPQDIGRVVLNLINNAFYAVDEKRKTASDSYEPTVAITTASVQSSSGGRGVAIKVSDNGGGIPQKVLDKIFQPFFTTKPTGLGTGLGLSLSYDIVKAHGGEIKVNTNENEGTEFTIQLPVV